MITDVFRYRLGRAIDTRWVDGAAFVGSRVGKEGGRDRHGPRRRRGDGRVRGLDRGRRGWASSSSSSSSSW